MTFSPLISKSEGVSVIMLKVLLALLPGIALYVWYFGPAILVSIALASLTALATEAAMLRLRNRPVMPFPAQMTHWVAPHGLGDGGLVPAELGFAQQLQYIFSGVLPQGLTLDAVTMATPLDNLKTHLHLEESVQHILNMPIYGQIGGHGSEMVAWGFLFGGLYLLVSRIISWHIPVAYLVTLFVIAGIFHLVDPAHYVAPLFHWYSGAAMLGAFFILTDPVSSPTTDKGRLIYAAGAALLTYLIRTFGGFPDGVAFATLLMNISVPLIVLYTQPKVFGKKDPDGIYDKKDKP
jgi:electron transport complex protein RnfD